MKGFSKTYASWSARVLGKEELMSMWHRYMSLKVTIISLINLLTLFSPNILPLIVELTFLCTWDKRRICLDAQKSSYRPEDCFCCRRSRLRRKQWSQLEFLLEEISRSFFCEGRHWNILCFATKILFCVMWCLRDVAICSMEKKHFLEILQGRRYEFSDAKIKQMFDNSFKKSCSNLEQ